MTNSQATAHRKPRWSSLKARDKHFERIDAAILAGWPDRHIVNVCGTGRTTVRRRKRTLAEAGLLPRKGGQNVP